MHGEFKVPAGKLVVVDLATDAGRLRDVRVSGDFFLEPDDALLDIDDALIGAPADSTAADLTARIERALPAGTVMYGFSPRDVATAVRRALSEATSWTDHEWLLVHEPPKSPAYHMALDQTLIEEVAAGRHVPDPAGMEVGLPVRGDRVLPVAAQRGRSRRCRALRHRGGAAHQWRWRDVHRAGQHDHVLALCARVTRRRPLVPGFVRVPR